jgi:hypothetical protein
MSKVYFVHNYWGSWVCDLSRKLGIFVYFFFLITYEFFEAFWVLVELPKHRG